jgi:lipopolysaccharide export system permease protein
MFKLPGYILKEHIGPFFFTFFILMFLFVVKFLLQYSERLFGKGLSIFVIFEFIFVNLAWMIALVVPMSVLVATLIAFGRFSADNEIIALKSAGINIYRLIRPPIYAAIVLTLIMVWFNDQVLPELNHRARIMLNEISRKKPTLNIEPGIFQALNNGRYYLYVENMIPVHTDSSLIPADLLTSPLARSFTDRLEQVSIFFRDGSADVKTITANFGFMHFDEENANVVLFLYEGELHEKVKQGENEYRRTMFNLNKVNIPADEFLLRRENDRDYRGDREMSIAMMQEKVAHYKMREEKSRIKRAEILSKFEKQRPSRSNYGWKQSIIKAEQHMDYLANQIKYTDNEIDRHLKRQNQYVLEIYKKYSIPFACIVFVLIGAPLGMMSRKGGMAIGFSLSVAFFLIFWVSLILGESLSDKRIITPFWAMWSANILVGIVGIYLIYSAVKETRFLDVDRLKQKMQFWKKSAANV